MIDLAANLLSPLRVNAQRSAPAPSDVDSSKVQPLDLKPGCWQVRTHSSTVTKESAAQQQAAKPSEKPHVMTMQEWKEEIMSKSTPEQRAQLTPEMLKVYYDSYVATMRAQQGEDLEKKSAEFGRSLLAKGASTTELACTATPFIQQGQEIYGTLPRECTRTMQKSGREMRARVTCPAKTTDYVRTDSENFAETVQTGAAANQSNPTAGAAWTTTTTYVGKWIGEASSHMPHAVPATDLDGVRPKGPEAVAGLDPFRIVATIGGKQLVAAQALGLMKSGELFQYPAELGEILRGQAPIVEGKPMTVARDLQQLYMHREVSDEAVQMHLDKQHPWLDQLQQKGLIRGPGSPDWDPNAYLAERNGILWYAFFSQAKTPAEKQELMRREQEKYKLTVVDPDFFYSATNH